MGSILSICGKYEHQFNDYLYFVPIYDFYGPSPRVCNGLALWTTFTKSVPAFVDRYPCTVFILVWSSYKMQSKYNFDSMGSFINDVVQIWYFFNTPSQLYYYVFLRLRTVLYLLCISTIFQVLAAPDSWLKYFFQPFST